MAYANIAVILLSCVILLCGQYDILFCSLSNMVATAQLTAQHNKDVK